MEKEQSYKDAAINYENAWKYGNKNNPVIGRCSVEILFQHLEWEDIQQPEQISQKRILSI